MQCFMKCPDETSLLLPEGKARWECHVGWSAVMGCDGGDRSRRWRWRGARTGRRVRNEALQSTENATSEMWNGMVSKRVEDSKGWTGRRYKNDYQPLKVMLKSFETFSWPWLALKESEERNSSAVVAQFWRYGRSLCLIYRLHCIQFHGGTIFFLPNNKSLHRKKHTSWR